MNITSCNATHAYNTSQTCLTIIADEFYKLCEFNTRYLQYLYFNIVVFLDTYGIEVIQVCYIAYVLYVSYALVRFLLSVYSASMYFLAAKKANVANIVDDLQDDLHEDDEDDHDEEEDASYVSHTHNNIFIRLNDAHTPYSKRYITKKHIHTRNKKQKFS